MLENAKVYLVGGAVRDNLLGLPVTERDWVVVGATQSDMLKEGFVQVGKDFPVYLHPSSKEEYALARTERKVSRGYTGFECNSAQTVTLEEDLLRRDLTINAMAQNACGDIIDPYQGLTDIETKTLRHVSPAFSEDPLRILRVARFAARFAHLGFSVADDTLQLMQTMANAGELGTLPAERVWRETEKAMTEQCPDIFFAVLSHAKATSPWFESLYPAITGQKVTSTLRRINEGSTSALIQKRCLALSLLLPQGQNSQWLKSIKAPKKMYQLSVTLDKLICHLPLVTTKAESMLALFNTADVWRKEQDFTLLVEVMEAVYAHVDEHWAHTQASIQASLAAAKHVSAKALVDAGLKGMAIKQALEQKRLDCIGDSLNL